MSAFEFDSDEDRQMLRVVSHGIWSEKDALGFAAALRREFEAARARWGVVRLLIDGRDTSAQPPHVSRHYRFLAQQLMSHPDDRLAVVVGNSLIKTETRRAAETDQLQVFLSPNAAETWLLAHL